MDCTASVPKASSGQGSSKMLYNELKSDGKFGSSDYSNEFKQYINLIDDDDLGSDDSDPDFIAAINASLVAQAEMNRKANLDEKNSVEGIIREFVNMVQERQLDKNGELKFANILISRKSIL